MLSGEQAAMVRQLDELHDRAGEVLLRVLKGATAASSAVGPGYVPASPAVQVVVGAARKFVGMGRELVKAMRLVAEGQRTGLGALAEKLSALMGDPIADPESET